MSAGGGQSAPEPVPSGIEERPSAGLVSYVHELGTGVIVVGAIGVICGVVAGIAVVKRPGDTLVVIVLAVGLWLFGSGVVEMLNAAFTPGRRALGLLIGAIDVIFAIVILSWPKISLGTLAVLTGIVFIIRGALMVYNGLQVRRAASAA